MNEKYWENVVLTHILNHKNVFFWTEAEEFRGLKSEVVQFHNNGMIYD